MFDLTSLATVPLQTTLTTQEKCARQLSRRFAFIVSRSESWSDQQIGSTYLAIKDQITDGQVRLQYGTEPDAFFRSRMPDWCPGRMRNNGRAYDSRYIPHSLAILVIRDISEYFCARTLSSKFGIVVLLECTGTVSKRRMEENETTSTLGTSVLNGDISEGDNVQHSFEVVVC